MNPIKSKKPGVNTRTLWGKHPGILVLGGCQYQVADHQHNQLYYNFKPCLHFLEAKGKLLFGKEFKIYEQDKALVYKLICYFIEDAKECYKFGIQLDKGILLSGPVGCGKTSLMQLLPHLVPHKRISQYEMLSCRKIVFEFNKLGYQTLEEYAEFKAFCFDDLGVEAIGRHYGKDCNVMGEILISRYESFQRSVSNQLKTYNTFNPSSFRGLRGRTHITTNLNAEELEQKYGERVRSRMRKLFNLIAFDKNCDDKRK